jgi:N6-adenosine-specific RNA methylase IME4
MKFATIYCDPAWNFVTYSDKGAGRSPEQHYQTMTVDDICALPVAALATEDAALFMWAVDPRLPDALKVGAAWGFEYKTVAFTWTKQVASRTQPSFLPVDHNFHWHIGNGYWSRSNTRGNPMKPMSALRNLLAVIIWNCSPVELAPVGLRSAMVLMVYRLKYPYRSWLR